GRELAAFVRERFARAARDPRDIAAFPGARVEYQAASTGPRRAAQSGESIAEIVVCGGGAGIDESLLVCPLRDGLTRRGIGDADVGAPGVLAKEQQVAPQRRPIGGAVAPLLDRILVVRLDAIVPERHALGGPSGQLRRAKCRELRRHPGVD